MDERERYRLAVARDVAKLRKHRSLRDALRPLLPDGTAPFIIGLPEDTLGFIAARTEALGGEAHLIVPAPSGASGTARLRILRIGRSTKEIAELDDHRECAVSQDSTLAILLDHIEVGEELTYYAYDAETVIRFINDSVQPIPA